MSAFASHFPLIQEELHRFQGNEETENLEISDNIARLFDYSSTSFPASAPPRPDLCRLLIEHTCSQLATYTRGRNITQRANERNQTVLRVVVSVLDTYSHSNGNLEPIKDSVSDLLQCWYSAAVKSGEIPLPLNMVLQMHNLRSAVNVIRLLLDGSPQEIDAVNAPSGTSGERPLHHLMKSDIPLTHKKLIVQLLIDKGVHIDAVDKNGKDATHAIFPLSLKSPLHIDINHIHDMICLITHDYPLPLSCLAAKAVITNGLHYKRMLLPPRLKQIISYHDPHASLSV